MSFVSTVIRAAEQAPVPDAVLRLGIEYLVGRTRRKLVGFTTADEAKFARDMDTFPVATHTDEANTQHYELPPEFFSLTLGDRRKYSCCYYETGRESLEEAEVAALERTVANAGLADGQMVLELGCGWGSLTLFMAERYPRSRILAVSNSRPQRLHIERQATARGLSNVTVVTADMNAFEPGETRFDRIVSVEMFEHMSNWHELLRRAKSWMKPDGRMFVHVFSHHSQPYRFNHEDDADWIAQHFFTGGIMPSHGLIRHFPDCFEVEQDWRWSGTHYQRTAIDWLERFDANRRDIDTILFDVYGADADLWRGRWRLFYLATAGLFGHAGGSEWGVSHYRLRPTA